jgi:hypothetical protein
MKAKQKISFMVDVDAFCPGLYRGVPSYSYLYYGEEYKTFLDNVLTADISALT